MGVTFPLVRERSVIQYLLELELRPELPPAQSFNESGFEVVKMEPAETSASSCVAYMDFEWEVHDFPLLETQRGRVSFAITADRSFRKNEMPEVRTYLDVKRGCELRRNAAGNADARNMCQQALQLFESRLAHDRFGFAAEWANKTKALLEDTSLWKGTEATAGAAKHLGYAHSKAVVEEEEEE